MGSEAIGNDTRAGLRVGSGAGFGVGLIAIGTKSIALENVGNEGLAASGT